jgi:hypothetical protein
MGIGTAPTTMKTQYVKVVRAFFWQGKPTKVGDVIELPSSFAAEMVTNHKAERVDAPVKPVDTPVTTPAAGRKKE